MEEVKQNNYLGNKSSVGQGGGNCVSVEAFGCKLCLHNVTVLGGFSDRDILNSSYIIDVLHDCSGLVLCW